MARHRFRYVGPSNDYLRTECANDDITVINACDGAIIDVDIPNEALSNTVGVMTYPNHMLYLGEVNETPYNGEGPHVVDTLVSMLADCRGYARIDVAITNATSREVYVWAELRVVRVSAAPPELVGTTWHYVASGWNAVSIGLDAIGENLAVVISLPPFMPSVLIDTHMATRRLS